MKREEEKREMVDKDKSELMVYNSRVHCKELFKEVLKFHKNDGFDNFEHISFFIKKKFSSKKFQYAKKVVPQRNIIECTKYEKAQLFESTKKSKKKDIEFSNGLLEDIPNNFRMLEWAGISFNSTENYKLTLSIKVI